MPDINEPTEAEIEAVKADQLWWQQVEEPLGLRLGGWTFRKHALFFDISTGATIELPGTVAERVIAARRVSSAPSFADGVEAPSQPRPNWNGWRSIDTAPEDCRVILATAGNWVGEAIMLRDEDTGEQVWTWVDTGKPSLHSCYGWMPLPEPLLVPALSDLRPDGFDGPTGAE